MEVNRVTQNGFAANSIQQAQLDSLKLELRQTRDRLKGIVTKTLSTANPESEIEQLTAKKVALSRKIALLEKEIKQNKAAEETDDGSESVARPQSALEASTPAPSLYTFSTAIAAYINEIFPKCVHFPAQLIGIVGDYLVEENTSKAGKASETMKASVEVALCTLDRLFKDPKFDVGTVVDFIRSKNLVSRITESQIKILRNQAGSDWYRSLFGRSYAQQYNRLAEMYGRLEYYRIEGEPMTPEMWVKFNKTQDAASCRTMLLNDLRELLNNPSFLALDTDTKCMRLGGLLNQFYILSNNYEQIQEMKNRKEFENTEEDFEELRRKLELLTL